MYDAVLDLRFWVYPLDCFRKAFEVVCTGDEYVGNNAIPQTVKHRRPVFRAFVLTDPHAEYILFAVKIDADSYVDCFFDNLSLTANMVVYRIEKNYGIYRFQRPLLPIPAQSEVFYP